MATRGLPDGAPVNGFSDSAGHPELEMLVHPSPPPVEQLSCSAGLRRSDRDASSEVQSHLRAVVGNALTPGGPRVRRK